jgi:hypothetical protein
LDAVKDEISVIGEESAQGSCTLMLYCGKIRPCFYHRGKKHQRGNVYE